MTIQKVSVSDLGLDLDHVLQEFSFFETLPEQAIRVVKKRSELLQLDCRDVLMNQGDVADYVYFVLCGKLRVYAVNADDEEVVFSYLKRGDTVGEMAALSGHVRSASVQATRFTVVLRISNEDFLEILKSNAEQSVLLSQQLVQRLEASNQRAREHRPPRPVMNALGVIPSGGNDVTQEFIKAFTPCLREYKSVFNLTPDILKEQGFVLQDDKAFTLADRARLAFYLAELEQQYECVLFDAGATASAWCQFVLNNVDALIAVADAQADSALSVVEQYIDADKDRYTQLNQYLVLIHPSIQSSPHNTASWLNSRHIYSSHHITYDLPKSLRSLARIMTGCCVNLVLSGGGARGYVHIGVLKALRELGVEVDTVSGVSMGSIVGAMIAMEKGPDEITADCLSLFAGNPLQGLSLIQLPLTSIVKPKSYRKLFYKVYRDLKIEDLWKKYFCLTVNMTQAKEHVFNTGSLVEAVMGSAGLPIMASPLISRGDMHVDGCVLNTMPVDIAKQLYGGEVICVQVAKDSTYPCDKEDDIFPSSWQIFCRMLNPFKKIMMCPC